MGDLNKAKDCSCKSGGEEESPLIGKARVVGGVRETQKETRAK